MSTCSHDSTPRQVLARFYEAEALYMKEYEENGTARFDKMRETLDSHVVLHQSPDLPFGGEYVGHQQYEEWAKRMSAIFDRLEVREQMFLETENVVVVLCRFVTRSRINGTVQDFPMAQAVTVINGKITDFRPFYWNVPAYIAAAQEEK